MIYDKKKCTKCDYTKNVSRASQHNYCPKCGNRLKTITEDVYGNTKQTKWTHKGKTQAHYKKE